MKSLPELCRRDLFLLVVLSTMAGVPGLGGFSITRGDERFYIQTAVTMPESGHYLVPTYLGKLHLNKPPLMNWLALASCKVFGFSLWAARLPALFAGALVVSLTFLIALRLYGDRMTSLMAGLMGVSSYGLYLHSRVALTDMVMLCGLLLLFLQALKFIDGDRSHLTGFIAALGIGIAVMAKGHVGFVLALLPCVAMCVVERKTLRTIPPAQLMSPAFWLPAIILGGWWYVVILTDSTSPQTYAPSHTGGEATVAEAFVNLFRSEEIQGRATGNLEAVWRNLKRYSVDVFRICFPWSLLAVAGFVIGGKPLMRDYRDNRRQTLFLLCLVLPTLLFFVLVIRQQARSRYLLPVIPGIAIFAARVISLKFSSNRKALHAVAGISIMLLVSFNLILVYAVPMFRGQPKQNAAIEAAAIMAPEDSLIVTGFWPAWHTFTGAMLGRDVICGTYQPGFASMAQPLAQAGEHTIYVIMDRQYFDKWAPDQQSHYEVISEYQGLIDKVRVNDLFQYLKGEPSKPENTVRVVLMKYVGPRRKS